MNAAIAFGLPPAVFWRLSLREWRAIAAPGASDALQRVSFDALAARFPDQAS
jgi:uncharacterized phage protein (TIGR02216 family)